MKFTAGIIDLCIGSKIGSGYSRDVYEWLPDPTKVIKIAREDNQFTGIAANIAEFELWDRVAYNETYVYVKSWLAPVHLISDDGTCMLQSKTEPMRASEAPSKVPAWMTDIKIDNAGFYEDRIVFHDYALNLIPEKGLSKKLVKAVWY